MKDSSLVVLWGLAMGSGLGLWSGPPEKPANGKGC